MVNVVDVLELVVEVVIVGVIKIEVVSVFIGVVNNVVLMLGVVVVKVKGEVSLVLKVDANCVVAVVGAALIKINFFNSF
jgi:hypothetical protein